MARNNKEFKHEFRMNEYNALREELRVNRRFIFERPALIVGAAFAASTLLNMKNINFDLISIAVIIILFFNLWFTINRLKSSSRIISYINIFHESKYKKYWIGWENSLIKYREWCMVSDEKHKNIRYRFSTESQYGARRFYGPIYIFHLTISLLVVLSKLLYIPEILRSNIDNITIQIYLIQTLILVILFILLSIISYLKWNPKIVQNSILAELDLWKNVFREDVPDFDKEQSSTSNENKNEL